jgi:hypothetical protein
MRCHGERDVPRRSALRRAQLAAENAWYDHYEISRLVLLEHDTASAAVTGIPSNL